MDTSAPDGPIKVKTPKVDTKVDSAFADAFAKQQLRKYSKGVFSGKGDLTTYPEGWPYDIHVLDAKAFRINVTLKEKESKLSSKAANFEPLIPVPTAMGEIFNFKVTGKVISDPKQAKEDQADSRIDFAKYELDIKVYVELPHTDRKAESKIELTDEKGRKIELAFKDVTLSFNERKEGDTNDAQSMKKSRELLPISDFHIEERLRKETLESGESSGRG